MQKINSVSVAAGSIRTNYKETVKRFIAKNNAFSFTTRVKETPAHWKQFLYEVLAMAKQLGVPTFFLTLLCANLRCDELPHTINKLNKLGLSDDEIKNVSYEQRKDIKLVTNEGSYMGYVMKANFRSGICFSESLMDSEMGKMKIVMNKPVYLGQAV